MLEIEKAALRCLLTEVSFGVFSKRKHFVRDLGYACVGPKADDFRMTKPQALYFWKIVDFYRRQISNPAVKHFAAQRVLTGELPEFYTDADIRVIEPKPSKPKRSVSKTAQAENLFT